MPIVKKIDKITLIGITHLSSEQNRGFEKYIKHSDILALEGYGNRELINLRLLRAFFGEDEISLLKKLHIHLTTLDPILNKRIKIPLKSLAIIGAITSLFTEIFYFTSWYLNQNWISYLPYLYVSLFAPAMYGYFSKRSNKILNSKYYLKFLDSNLKILAQVGRFLTTHRDVGMAYGIKKLIQNGYRNVTAITGMMHIYPIYKCLNDDKLEEKFTKLYRKKLFKKTGLTIYDPYDLEEIGFIPYI